MSQDEAAAALGRSQSYIARCERAARPVDAEELRQFAALYGKPISFFLDEGPCIPPPSDSRLKRRAFTVRASHDQARRWKRVALYLGCRSVSAWLEELADEQARRIEDLVRRVASRHREPTPPGR